MKVKKPHIGLVIALSLLATLVLVAAPLQASFFAGTLAGDAASERYPLKLVGEGEEAWLGR